MKKILVTGAFLAILVSLVCMSCKKEDNDMVSPTYDTQAAGGTGNNPNLGK